MSNIGHITLNDPALRSRLKYSDTYVRRSIERAPRRMIQDISTPLPTNKDVVVKAGTNKNIIDISVNNSTFQNQPAFNRVVYGSFEKPKNRSYKAIVQLSLAMLAVLMIGFGAYLTYTGLISKNELSQQVTKLSAEANVNKKNSSVVPSTIKPSSNSISNYYVAPDHPRYLNIPKLNVHARVLSVGVTSSGALGTPNNVFDTAWYNESSEPGQPGAVLIDGHVSSWTSNGVFYGLKDLKPGDILQIVRGDGKLFNYKVVKTVIFSSNKVNMMEALSSVNPNVPGLNLMSCTGDVIPGTNEFNQRILVLSTQIN